MALERRVEIRPAYNKRSTDPKKDYGIGAAIIYFLLIDKEARQAVQFVIATGWYLPGSHTGKSRERVKSLQGFKGVVAETDEPMPFDLGYHSPFPTYEGQTPMEDQDCPVIGPGLCYYDGSGLNAYEAFGVLVEKGSDGLWAFLSDYYRNTFLKEAGATET